MLSPIVISELERDGTGWGQAAEVHLMASEWFIKEMLALLDKKVEMD